MITIRPASLNEIDTLNKLIALSAAELSRDDYTEQQIHSAIQYVFGVDTDLVTDQTYFVIEKDGEIAGCGGWSKRKTLFGGSQYAEREDTQYLDPTKDAAKIRAFFIHPQFARQGLGTLLLKHCEQEAFLHGFDQFEMMATLPGVKLYKNLSYRPLSDEVLTLKNNVSLTLVRMRKCLKDFSLIRASERFILFQQQDLNEEKNSIDTVAASLAYPKQ